MKLVKLSAEHISDIAEHEHSARIHHDMSRRATFDQAATAHHKEQAIKHRNEAREVVHSGKVTARNFSPKNPKLSRVRNVRSYGVN